MQLFDLSISYKPNDGGSVNRRETKLALQKFVSAKANKRLMGKVKGND